LHIFISALLQYTGHQIISWNISLYEGRALEITGIQR
jgi:hypothetical protein